MEIRNARAKVTGSSSVSIKPQMEAREAALPTNLVF
jgi:hypothetical protein